MIIFLILLNYFASSQNIEKNFEKANSYFQEEKYDLAIESYEDILNQDIKSSELYYNLANAYYRNENIGMSILYYNKALKIDPNFEDAKFNLEIAKLKTVDKFDEIPTFFLDDISKSISNSFNEKNWTIINVIISFSIFVLLILFRTRKNSNSKRQILLFVIILSVLFLFSFYFGYKQHIYESSLTNGVITSSSTYIKSSPDENSKDLIILHEGTSFDLTDEIGEWVEIKLSDGNKGWVSIKDIERY